jgi:RNA polymerase sigma factor (sigma-70 family)
VSRRSAEIAAAAGGDQAARWRALEASRDYLRLVVRRGRWSNKAGQPATSDLVQKTILDAWCDFSKFQGRSAVQLRAWLRAILIHASLNSRRGPHEAPFTAAGRAADIPDRAASPSQVAQKADAHAALDAALAQLGERYRVVVRLRVWDRLSFAEIGARLAISDDAARMLYGRAIAKLRESMRSVDDVR